MHVTREPNLHAFRTALDKVRVDANVSYELLAERTGLHRLTVLRMLRGHRGGSLESWWRIATALDADFAAMVRLLDEA